MIITQILGGLGNQLFQYAAAKALAVRTKTDVKLDVTGFADYHLRQFGLDHFQVNVEAASQSEISQLKAETSFQRVKERFTPVSRRTFYKQPFYHFDPRFFALRPPVYLRGYFQSEKYFAPVQELIRRELVFNDAFSSEIVAFGEDLQQQNSVAVHLRRGDYKNPESLHVHGILTTSYYQRAIAHLQHAQEKDLRFYLFSDDPGAAKDLKIPEAVVVSGEISTNHLEDFFLMQQCRHNVIANSSFSWWAAWLNNHKDKKVIAPAQWFANGPKDTQDLLPPGWVRL